MRITLRTVFDQKFIELDVADDKPFIQIIDEIDILDLGNKRKLSIEEFQILERLSKLSTRPAVYSSDEDGKNIFDFFKSPNDLGLSDGAEIILSFAGRKGAGVLPLNSLYNHHRELKNYLKNQHLGLQAVFLYTSADEAINKFMNKYLYSEIIHLSRNCIVYAPIKDIFDENHPKFLKWWKQEYNGLDLFKSLNRGIKPFYTVKYRNTYEVAKSLGLTESELPAVLFFQTHFIENAFIHLRHVDNEFKFMHTIRKVFSIANEINEKEIDDKITELKKELLKFEKANNKRITKFPFTLINLNLLSIKAGSIIDKLIGTVLK